MQTGRLGTDRQLRNGVVDDVERVRTEEIECDLADEGDGVDHAGLDDNDEDSPVSEVGRASTLAEHIPAAARLMQSRINKRAKPLTKLATK